MITVAGHLMFTSIFMLLLVILRQRMDIKDQDKQINLLIKDVTNVNR